MSEREEEWEKGIVSDSNAVLYTKGKTVLAELKKKHLPKRMISERKKWKPSLY